MMAIAWIILVLLFGLRYRVGGDTMNYMFRFEHLSGLTGVFDDGLELGRFQPLWIIFFGAMKQLSSDFTVLQIVHAVIVNTIIFRFINLNTRYFFTGILVYFLCYSLYFNMEILRESISICIFLLSLKSFNNRKWLNYYLFIFVAFLFHYSAIILFFLPFFRELKVSARNLLFLLAYFIVGLGFSRILLQVLNNIQSDFTLFEVITPYLDYTFTVWGILYTILVYMAFPILIYILSKFYFKIDIPHYQFLAFYILVAASISYFSIFFRFLNYFTPILCLYITDVLHAIFREKGRLRLRAVSTFISFSLAVFLFVNQYFSDTSDIAPNTRWYYHWYPYHSVIDKKVSEDRERLIEAENPRDGQHYRRDE